MFGHIDQMLPAIGVSAVDFLISMITRHETGVTTQQRSLQIQPEFREI